MRPLGEFIGKRSSLNEPAPLDDKTVFFIFQKIIREEYGMRGAAELKPVIYTDGILSIGSNNPLYSSELLIRREVIRERMNSALGQDVIRELRLTRYTP
ncbi:MAG: DUF721 domain-containing protein [Candidatus Moraniibacteriota bacterium]|nr:MAG: DUF721 domain-containing protein [Candidatus Moranbacteria bacterium]